MKIVRFIPLVFAVIILEFSCTKENFIDMPGFLVPKTVCEDLSLPSIIINGIKLHAQAYGPPDSTLIICIHGGPGGNFRNLLNCKSLANYGYRVVFYDQMGSGLSQRISKELIIKDGIDAIQKLFYEELRNVIKYYTTKPNQKVILLTHSWGSILATGYTGKYPNEVNGLIVAEPGGLKWEDIFEYVGNSRSLGGGIWSEALNDVTYLDQFITGKEKQHEILDYKLALLSVNNSSVGDISPNLGANGYLYKASRYGGVISAAMFEIGQKVKPDFSEGISRYLNKVLFFYSSYNKAFSDNWATKISSVYPKKEIIKVQGVGHSGMYDQFDIWSNVTEPKILAFLKNL